MRRYSVFELPAVLFLLLLSLSLSACERPDPQIATVSFRAMPTTTYSFSEIEIVEEPTSTAIPIEEPTVIARPTYTGTPTPNPTRHIESANGSNLLSHQVSAGETLGQIARSYGTTIEELSAINGIEEGAFLSVGQTIFVPGNAQLTGPDFKVVPDSEIVYGPGLEEFDLRQIIPPFGGYLSEHNEEVEGIQLSGPEVVQLIANRQSINPRLLLALIEYKSGWVTGSEGGRSPYPLGYVRAGYEGLYQQLNWAANQLSLGYYGRAEGGLDIIEIGAGERVALSPSINDGTAGVQLLMAAFPDVTFDGWLQDVGPNGFFATYDRLFGNPFAFTYEPLWPEELTQPPLTLPWSNNETWYFTGGPHGGWASGSAWAALDFTPADENVGCNVANEWVVAVADGLVARSEYGSLVLDLDADGYPGSGWAVIYFHVSAQDRVQIGEYVRAGDPLGHPSCEGGFSNWTHLHIARTYNGRWVSADGPYPFVLAGWRSQGLGREYDGLLVKGNEVKEACECREESNAVTAE